MRQFTDSDVRPTDTSFDGYICAEREELVYDPPKWMAAGRQETASGYGSRLNSGLKINFNGRLYRIYVTVFSNNGTAWFKTKGKRYIVR